MERYYLIMYWDDLDHDEIAAYTTNKDTALAKLRELMDRDVPMFQLSTSPFDVPPAAAVNLDTLPPAG